jgi:hypothetical protein
MEELRFIGIWEGPFEDDEEFSVFGVTVLVEEHAFGGYEDLALFDRFFAPGARFHGYP